LRAVTGSGEHQQSAVRLEAFHQSHIVEDQATGDAVEEQSVDRIERSGERVLAVDSRAVVRWKTGDGDDPLGVENQGGKEEDKKSRGPHAVSITT